MTEKDCTIIDIIRHGEPVGGIMIRGQQDDPLSPLGWQQMRTAVSAKSANWDLIVSSPLSRCLDFAKEIANKKALPLIVESRFKEIAFGEWQGRTKQQIGEDLVKKFQNNPNANIPKGAEYWQDFYGRVIQAWQDLIKQQRNKKILLVGHAGIIRAIATFANQTEPNRLFSILVPFAAIARLQINYEGQQASTTLMTLNYTYSD